MNTSTARHNCRQLTLTDHESLGCHAALPGTAGDCDFPTERSLSATHDFLVPNPRPDLTGDPYYAWMIE